MSNKKIVCIECIHEDVCALSLAIKSSSREVSDMAEEKEMTCNKGQTDKEEEE